MFLIELQDIDSEMKRLEARKRDLPEEKERMKEALARVEDDLDQTKAKIDELNQAHRAKEQEMKNGVDGVKKAKSRLLEVKTNKEYEATLKEIESLEKKNGVVEDEIIRLLDEVDQASTALKTKEETLRESRADYEKRLLAVEGEIGSIDAVFEGVVAKDRSIRENIDPDILRKYDLIRQRRNGNAVVPAWKEICGGCHVNMPPQLYIELQKYERVITCPNCNRIIYWENRKEEQQ